MNESVKAMIAKLHARLDDLSEVVEEVPFELNGYDKKLDRIDDQVYLIEVDLEKKLKNAVPIAPVSAAQSDAFDAAASGASNSTSQAAAATVDASTTSASVSNSPVGNVSRSTVHIVEGAEADSVSKVTIEPGDHDVTAAAADANAAEASSVSATSASAESEASQAGSGEKKQEGFLTDSAKETIAGATKTLNSLYKDGKEVVGEFSEAFGDIKEVLKKSPFKKR